MDIFPQTAKIRKRLWICSLARKIGKDIQPIQSSHVESCVLLSKIDVDKHIKIEIEMDELDLTASESKATYPQIKEYCRINTVWRCLLCISHRWKESAGLKSERITISLKKRTQEHRSARLRNERRLWMLWGILECYKPEYKRFFKNYVS